jgi:uncharacterized protein
LERAISSKRSTNSYAATATTSSAADADATTCASAVIRTESIKIYSNPTKLKMEERDLMSKFLAEMRKENPDLKVAFDLLQTAARQKNSEALYAIGTWHLFGKFVKKDPSEAVKYFLQAIEGNRSDAYYDLGVCYEKGVGIRKNKKAAFECYLNAALLGDKQALYEVGRCYFYGIGASKNMHVGEIWLKHAELNGIK